jgi:hypothetical protein
MGQTDSCRQQTARGRASTWQFHEYSAGMGCHEAAGGMTNAAEEVHRRSGGCGGVADRSTGAANGGKLSYAQELIG